MCHFWFHTGFIENNYLCFEKSVIDKACKVRGGGGARIKPRTR